jgi:hypothetical protein
MARETKPMRRQHRKNQRYPRSVLLKALSIVSQTAAIIATIIAIIDTLHRW